MLKYESLTGEMCENRAAGKWRHYMRVRERIGSCAETLDVGASASDLPYRGPRSTTAYETHISWPANTSDVIFKD